MDSGMWTVGCGLCNGAAKRTAQPYYVWWLKLKMGKGKRGKMEKGELSDTYSHGQYSDHGYQNL